MSPMFRALQALIAQRRLAKAFTNNVRQRSRKGDAQAGMKKIAACELTQECRREQEG